MRGNGGFTLIELILVTVIIGILAGMVVLNLGGRVQETQIRTAKGDITTLGTAVDLYRIDHQDALPKTLDDLPPKYIKEKRNDPWGNGYIYKQQGEKAKGDYNISSAGPDGVPNTEDDVTSTSEHEED